MLDSPKTAAEPFTTPERWTPPGSSCIKAPPNGESAVVEVLTRLGGHGNVLVIVNHPAAIGALPIAGARSLGVDVTECEGWP